LRRIYEQQKVQIEKFNSQLTASENAKTRLTQDLQKNSVEYEQLRKIMAEYESKNTNIFNENNVKFQALTQENEKLKR